ncbi:MAG: hypothetical protein M3R15_16735, partial [Acidobacteriota bacterium]|nr:hypothetical protein [Acidobacteriota bacterium]
MAANRERRGERQNVNDGRSVSTAGQRTMFRAAKGSTNLSAVAAHPKFLGSCTVRLRTFLNQTHPLEDRWCKPLGVGHYLKGRDVAVEIL